MKEYIIPGKIYQVLKWLGLIACPAVATFSGAVFPAWGIPNSDAVVLTLNATGVLIGALIGVSAGPRSRRRKGLSRALGTRPSPRWYNEGLEQAPLPKVIRSKQAAERTE